jgi:hypothetical protein
MARATMFVRGLQLSRRIRSQAERLRLRLGPLIAAVTGIAAVVTAAALQFAPGAILVKVSFWILLAGCALFVLERVLWLGVPALWWTIGLVRAARWHPVALTAVVALSAAWLWFLIWVIPVAYPRRVLTGRVVLIVVTWAVFGVLYQVFALRQGRR